MKNASPTRVVILSSLVVFICVLIFEWSGYFIPALHFPAYDLIIIPILVFTVSAFIYYTTLEKFIYNKIKLIYKRIHELKSGNTTIEDGKIKMNRDIFSEVNEDVMDWANNKSSEIARLKKQADYRKEFLGNVSHELKTPIMSIQGYLETLAEGGIHDDRINQAYVEKALRNVERMVEIIIDLENISMLESGEFELKPTRFDICLLAKDVFETFEMQAENRNVKLAIRKGTDREFFVVGDQNLIREVLVNLVGNGIKYGKKEGFVEIGFYEMGNQLLVEVSDNGIGISAEHINRVFERFYRVEKSRTRETGGTGLGLSIVKHILEAHGQTISVTSTPDEGSVFSFTLQRAN